MDPLELIREKVALLDAEKHPGLIAVAQHIDAANKHFVTARSTNRDYMFNDVIYRTNQAFEGILKEAYIVFSGKSHEQIQESRISPYSIEEYLADSDVFRPHVRAYFSTYRKEWRNPSTHDHGLDFDEQEAFLAIMTVSAFINVLLEQILEHAVYKKELADLREQDVARELQLESLPFRLQVEELLLHFSERIIENFSHPAALSESEISGRLQAYIAANLPNAKLKVQPTVKSQGHILRPDFSIRDQNTDDEIVLELKRYAPTGAKNYDALSEQLVRYLLAIGIHDGIGYIVPDRSSMQMATKEVKYSTGDGTLNVTIIYPTDSTPQTTSDYPTE